MKIYISADIEGVAGVVTPLQGTPGNGEYERARRLMTEEVNAAINGAFAGGATEVLVNDSHGPMTNLLPELLDPRAELIQGKPKPPNMVAELTEEYAGAFFLGYHAGAGRHGVLSHTVNGFAFREIRLNGQPCSEATLNGAYAGSLGVPVLLLSGDDLTAQECGAHFPGAQVVTTKRALSHRAARSLSPARAQERLRAAAIAALARARIEAPALFTIAGPYQLELVMTPALADLAAVIPVARRIDPITVGFHADTIGEVLGWINALSPLLSTLR